MSPAIVLIVISYKKAELIETFLASERELADHERAWVVVVDNATSAESRAVLEPLASERVHILFEKENHGYFGGSQVALEWIRARGLAPEWVVISNSDIAFPQKDFWPRLMSRREPDIGVVAPRITAGPVEQNPFYAVRPTKRRMHFYKWVFRWYVTGVLYGYLAILKARLRPAARPEADLRRSEIYAPHGAFMIFHRRYFESGADFKHGAFLFNEEFTVAENCRARGLKVVFEPDLRVEHADHGTMGWRPNRMIQRSHGEASRFTADTYFRE